MNQIKNIYLLFTKTNLIFFLKTRGYIHKIDSYELVLVKCVVYAMYHSYHAKRVYWSLESRRPDSI